MQYLTEINREPIREVLAKYLFNLSGSKTILEVASGDGTHVSHFAKAFPSSIEWQPTEYDEQVLVVSNHSYFYFVLLFLDFIIKNCFE